MTPEPIEEAELQRLVRKAQEGDSDAFERVYSQFFLPIYRYTAFRVPAEAAEDIVADIFVKAWEKLHQYSAQKGVPFGAWLFRIARHTIIDNYRKDRSYDELSEELMDTDDFNRADTRVKSADTLRIVRESLAKLPTRYRDILLLSYVAGLPHSEVARVLRMSEGGVRILKFRALKKLEGLLPPEMRNLA
jgi:RNA polymerase sigma-70 factor (ECF subfamily)